MGLTPDFWHNRRVMLTGHTGFKGSWLSLWLQQWGVQLVGYALSPPTTPNLFQVARVTEGLTSLHGDVRNYDQLLAAMQKYQPEIVIHMAAQPLVRYGYAHPLETYSTNVMGTVNLLEAVRHTSSVRVVVNITSDKCYEPSVSGSAHREADPMGGHDPYSSSKGCAELVTAAYLHSYFPPHDYTHHQVAVASVRAGNTIGGGDWALDRLVPDILKAFAEKRPVVIRSPQAIRPWQHVLEPLRGYLMLAEQLWKNGSAFAGNWNFGPIEADMQPVQFLVQTLQDLWGKEAKWQMDQQLNPSETPILRLDCSKSQTLLDWTPLLPLSQALEWIVAWYHAYQASQDMQAFTQQQIQQYQHKMGNKP